MSKSASQKLGFSFSRLPTLGPTTPMISTSGPELEQECWEEIGPSDRFLFKPDKVHSS